MVFIVEYAAAGLELDPTGLRRLPAWVIHGLRATIRHWTPARREAQKQVGVGFPSDPTDAQWARLTRLFLPSRQAGGRAQH